MKKYCLNIKTIYISLLALLLIATYSCITEYTPSGIEQTSGFLVVEGTITNGATSVQLTRTVGIMEENFNSLVVDRVTNASLYVECDDGTRLGMTTYIGDGKYSIATGVLNPDKKYRLYISVDGDEYQSEYLSPIYTPAIDSIFLLKDGPGEPVRLCVSTHDSPDKPRYYRWTYREIWEVHAALFANAGFLDGIWKVLPMEYYDINTPQNIYHCWGRDSSTTFLLGTTDLLSENVIAANKLKEMGPDNDRLSVLYYVSMAQNQIRKEAYDYFYGLQKNSEQTGGLYPPMPANYRGNIECINDPGRYVIGYVEVSTTATANRYFPTSTEMYEPVPVSSFCEDVLKSDIYPDFWASYAIYYAETTTLPITDPNFAVSLVVRLARNVCVDCRTKEKASKNRPDGWPTGNY